MRLTEKQRSAISLNLNAIAGGAFDERHVKELLVDIREFVGPKSLTRELAHFIAHYERNSGKYHSLFNARAVTSNLILDNPDSNDINGPVLGIDLTRIHQDLYESIFVSALNRNHHPPYPDAPDNLNISKVTAYLKQKYAKKNKFYELRENSALSSIYEIAMAILLRFDGKPLLSEEQLVEELNHEIKSFCNHYIPSFNFDNTIQRHGADVTICILSLLQDACFILYDGTVTNFELRSITTSKTISNYEQVMAGETKLAIVGRSGGMTNRYLTSNADPRNCVIKIEDPTFTPHLPSVRAERDAKGFLKLVPYSL